MTQEALKLAIQLRDTASGYWTENEISIIAKLIEALAQPEQEPVAWIHTKIDGITVPHRPADLDKHPERWEALYKTPPPCPTCEALARTVMLDQTSHDATPPQRTEQEPVAYDKTEMNCFVQDLYDKKMKEGKHGHYETMFHVVHQAIKRVPPQRTEQPPQRTEPVIDKSAAIRIATALGWTPPRTWVGLTDEERKDIELGIEVFGTSVEDILKEAEAKLKQKNGYAEEKNT